MNTQSFTSIHVYVTAVLFSLVIFVSACSQNENDMSQSANTSDTLNMRADHAFASPIEEAHHMSQWNDKGALKTDLKLSLGPNVTEATLYMETKGPGIRIELGKDTAAIYDGKEMYAMPSDSAVNPFTLKTWAYFLKVPYKLNDPGTMIKDQQAAKMQDKMYDRAKMTFKPGTGDTPNDWYILYRDQQNNRLRAMAYIVTYGSTADEANKNPHAISYENYQMVEGIPVATTWKFWGWNSDEGFSEQPLGEANLTNIEFMEPRSLFKAPKEANRMKRN